MDIQAAVDHLNSLLPLKARQERLPAPLKSLHQYILHCLVEHGRAPLTTELKTTLEKHDVIAVLQQLVASDLIVLDSSGENILGAYPVTLEQTPHQLMLHGNKIHAMCALDAVSVAPIFNTRVQIDSECHVSKQPIMIDMQGSTILQVQPGTEVMIGIRWQTPSAVAAHSLCLEMVFLKDQQSATEWQTNDQQNISLFTLDEAVKFGNAFFRPLLN